jgi:Tol biopolymer transport system component
VSMEAEAEAMFSPDGKSIAYSNEVNGVSQVFTRSLETSVPVQLTKCQTNCGGPAWAPDGSRIYYLNLQRGFDNDLFSISVAGGQSVLLHKGVFEYTISPDGNTIFMVASSAGSAETLQLVVASPVSGRPKPYPDFAERRFFLAL